MCRMCSVQVSFLCVGTDFAMFFCCCYFLNSRDFKIPVFGVQVRANYP